MFFDNCMLKMSLFHYAGHELSHGKLSLMASSISPAATAPFCTTAIAGGAEYRQPSPAKLALVPGRFPLWLADVKRFIGRSKPILEFDG